MAYWQETGGSYYSKDGYQNYPAIVQLKGGGEFIAWMDAAAYTGAARSIYGKLLDPAGAQQGADVVLASSLDAGSENTVRLVATPDGGFDAFWNESTPVNKLVRQQTTYVGQHFDSSGQAAGAKFDVSAELVWGYDANFQAVGLATGNILVSWESSGRNWRIVAPDGTPVTDVGTLDPAIVSGTVDITAAKDGGFYVAWTSTRDADGMCHAYFEKFDASGHAVGGPHLAINYGVLNDAHIAELADGNVVVTAEAYEAAAGQDMIFGAEFTPDGHIAGFRGEQINIPLGQRSHSHEVTALPDGGFYISWTQFTPTAYDGKLFMQRYDSGFARVPQITSDFVGDTGYGSEFSTVARAEDAPLFAWRWTNATDPGDIHAKVYNSVAAAGDDTIVGGPGIDTVSYAGPRANFAISRTADGVTVIGSQGSFLETDWLQGVERLHFSDTNVALDYDGTAGNAYRLYQAAFNRGADPEGLGYHIADLERGVPIEVVAQHFLESPEFQAHYGNVDNATFVQLLYSNVLHRGGDTAGIAYHLHDLDIGVSRAAVLVHFAESPENQAALVGVIENGMAYIPHV